MDDVRSFRLRVGRVRMKGGAEVTVFRSGPDRIRAEVRERAAQAAKRIASESDVSGYAMVWWDRTGMAATSWESREGLSCVRGDMVPILAHEALTQAMTFRWVMESLAEADKPKPPNGA